MVQQPLIHSIVRSRIGGVEVPIYPATANPEANYAHSAPWSYPTAVRVVKGDEPFYDLEGRTLAVYLETQPETDLAEDLIRAKKAVANAYRQSEPTNTGINQYEINLQGIPLTGYEVSVEVYGKEVPLAKVSDGEEPIQLVGSRPYTSARIDDQDMHDLLRTASPQMITVKFRGYYQMREIVITRVSAGMVESALTRVSESVRGGGFTAMGGVTRDARSDVKAAVHTAVRIEIDRNNNSDPGTLANLKSLVTEALDKFFSTARPISLEDALRIGDKFVVWSTDTARIELSPKQYRQLTTALQTGESFEQTWRKAYDYLLKTCHESDNYEWFYRKLRDDFKTGASGNGAFMGILSDGLTFSLSNDFENLIEEKKRHIEKFYSDMEESHMDKGTLKKVAYRNFTGEGYKAGVTPKPLKLYRVSSSQLSQEIINSAVNMHVVGVANVGSNFEAIWITPALYGSHFYDTFETDTLVVTYGDNNIRLKSKTKSGANSTNVLYVHIMYAI